jgi:hypothetical protein
MGRKLFASICAVMVKMQSLLGRSNSIVVATTSSAVLFSPFFHHCQFALSPDAGDKCRLVVLANNCLDLPVSNPALLLDYCWSLIDADGILDRPSMVFLAAT